MISMSREPSYVGVREFVLVVLLVGFLVNLFSSVVFYWGQANILSLAFACTVSLAAASVTVIVLVRMENVRKRKTMDTVFRLIRLPIEKFMRELVEETNCAIRDVYDWREDNFTDTMRARTKRWVPSWDSRAEIEQKVKEMMKDFYWVLPSIASEKEDTVKQWEMIILPQFHYMYAAAIQTEPSHANHLYSSLKELEATITHVIDFYYPNLPSEILEMFIQLEIDLLQYLEIKKLWDRYSPIEYPLHARQEALSMMLAGQQWFICKRVNDIYNLVRERVMGESMEWTLERVALRYIIDEGWGRFDKKGKETSVK